MIREKLVMICTPDFSGHVRGKSFPLSDLERRNGRGIGWVPTNVQITAFNSIADSPYGSLGDLLMVADPAAEVMVDFGDDSPVEHFFLGDIQETNGTGWECCVRGQLKKAIEALQRETGLELRCAFELEFQFKDLVPEGEFLFGPGFSLAGLRAKKIFGETFIAALRKAGVEPDSFLREWGDQQYEVTMHPQPSLVAADQALIIRELARATAQRLGEEITFTPLRDPDSAGNGVHIHMSLVDKSGAPVAYDPEGPGGLSEIGGRFVAGMLHHLPDIVAFTAPSVVSYARMTPHRWSAAFNNLGYRDREASVRICPVAEIPGADVARQFNVEFRAADSAAAPHLQLAAIIHAGLDGIRKGMTPPPPSEDDLSLLNPDELAARGFSRLPSSLKDALGRMESSKAVTSWFGERFVDVYARHKRGEIEFLREMTEEQVYAQYAKVY